MSTRQVLLLCFLFLSCMSLLAAFWKPEKANEGKLPLVWVTGSNPARIEQIETFNRENPSFDLQLDVGDAATQKVILQCSSGVGPEIFDIYDGEQLQTYAEAGVLWDITEAAKAGGFSAEENMWESGRREVTYQGKQYAYPCNIGTNILIFNKNVFDYLGIPYPDGILTWDEFLEMGEKINEAARKAALPHPVHTVSGLNWMTFFESMKGEYFTKEGIPNLSDSPELRQAIEMHRDFIFKHRLMPSSLELKSMSGQGGWGSGGLNQFAGGRFATIITGEWALIGLTRTHAQQVKDLESKGVRIEDIQNPLEKPLRLGSVLLPKFSERPPSYRVRSRSAGINVRSPHREEALAFLQYLAGPSYSTLVNEAADWLPGNPRYAAVGLAPGIPDLSRMEMHENTLQAMQYGYAPQNSPFALNSDVMMVLKKQISRLESNPSLPVESLLQTAQAELETLIRRNLDRNPELKARYEALDKK